MLKLFILIALAFTSAFAAEGVDISSYQGALSQDDFSCFVQNGKSFLIVQIWMGGYQLNSNFGGNWQNAKNAGIQYVDAYAFICNNCDGNTPDNICGSIKNNLPGGWDGQVWLDIEECSGCWSGDGGSNLDFVVQVADTCKSYGLVVGIYSSYYEWQSVTGSAGASSGDLTGLPLWYAHYDGNPSFSDWSSNAFGGWGGPNMKQYAGDTTLCGIDVDLDCY